MDNLKDLINDIDKQRLYEYLYMIVLFLLIMIDVAVTVPSLMIYLIGLKEFSFFSTFAGVQIGIMFVFTFLLNENKPKNSYHVLSAIVAIMTQFAFPGIVIIRAFVSLYGCYCLYQYYDKSTYEYIDDEGDEE